MIASRSPPQQHVLTSTGEPVSATGRLPEPTIRRLLSVARDVRVWPQPAHFAQPLALRNVRSVRLRDLVVSGLPEGLDVLQLCVTNFEPDVRAAYGSTAPSLERPFALLPVRGGRCDFDRLVHSFAFQPTDRPRTSHVEVRVADLEGRTLRADAVEVELEFDAD